ncbi:MAG: aminotransferase class V-fold PLP-dependent enzyme, partial [Raoultibacter sp.]
LGAESPACIAFSANATEALNIAISGLLRPGDHAITTAASHNSILRPLYREQQQGIELSIAPIGLDGSLDYEAFAQLFRSNTRAVFVTHASNLTGDMYDIDRLASLCHQHGALIIVDAAQTAGSVPITVTDVALDVLVFTGHKGLYGPQGTGGLYVSPAVEIEHYLVGGSGTQSHNTVHPTAMPERLEAGTMNGHGLAGLAAGVAFVEELGVESIEAHIQSLADRFRVGLQELDAVRIYGGGSGKQCGIVALSVEGVDAGTVADVLYRTFGICTRAGAHCAPLMHDALRTADRSAVRFSFSCFNNEKEIESALGALRYCVEHLLHR